ncbi:uncharacterized protein LOC121872325 isoform X3 [Homarus americanus]|uniref:uncharacterized protein LOC121872325 isoform X3 n=1 Tax=Homarus americanus TaxID=6706 RepID=UPI001C4825F9|nr:uncharacterized protein LOC121872325 isoform X3 [Homarus americanus]
MRLMGVITCTSPMNPTGNVTYTHKKFKRAQIEACDTVEKQQLHQEETGKNGKTETLAIPTKASIVSIEGTPSPINGILSSQTPNHISGHTGHFPLESDDGKKKNSGNNGGKYKCKYCGVGCAKPSVLDKHIRTHTNERPYSCDQCCVAFKTKSNYLKHTRSRAHALRCDGGLQEGSDGTIESSDNLDVDGDEGSRCPSREDGQQCQPADFTVAHMSARDQQVDYTSTSEATRLYHEESGKDRGNFIYKPKFRVRAQYSLQEESISKGLSPPIQRQQSTPPQDVTTFDSNTINSSTYQIHAASNPNHPSQGAHSSPSSHSPGPANASKQCFPPIEIRAGNRKDEGTMSGQRNSVVISQTTSPLWKGMKSPSPELVGQHITKLIVENQAIVETHNPLWSRRYRRQSSLGSSSSESDGSGSGKSRRYSLADTGIKNSKPTTTGPPPAGSGPTQPLPRERRHSINAEAIMVEPQSSYSPSLPPNPHLPLAQPTVTPISASKPSISSQGLTTSYSQPAPAFTASHVTMVDFSLTDGARKRCISEGPSVVRDLSKSRVMPHDDPALLRQHPQNPEGSVIKNLLLTARAGITGAIDLNLERQERARIANQVVSHGEIGPYTCLRCRIPCRSPEELEIHIRHYCGQRPGSERGTPDSTKSGDGGRWPGEQDVALDLQKKPEYMDQHDRERSSSRGSSTGETIHRRGSEEDSRYHLDMSPKVYRSKSAPDGSLPPTKKRKMSDIEITSHDRSMFLSPNFSSKGQGGMKSESGLKIMDDMNKQNKLNNHQLFGGEVQICDGNELKTMRIDPSQQSSPGLDICIPPQQLGGRVSKPEVSAPTSVVMTIAKSGLNSGGTMVQVENQISTSSTKTVPSVVSSSMNREQSVLLQNVPKAAHPPNMYNEANQFAFSPSFLQYAPHLQLPNLAIPGIPTPDLGGLSFSTYPPRIPGQTFLHGQTSLMQGILGNHKQNTVRSPVVSSRVSPGGFAVSAAGGSSGSSSVMHGGSNDIRIGDSTGAPKNLLVKDKEKEHQKTPSKLPPAGYPALIPVGDEKVPYVPGIPGPYSQGSVLQSHPPTAQRSPMTAFTPVTSSITSSAPLTSIPSLPALMSTAREKNLTIPKYREATREPPRSPVREHSQSLNVVKLPHRLSPRMSSVIGKVPERTVNPEIRIHPAKPESVSQEKKTSEKFLVPVEESNYENCSKEESSDSEDFLPPRKRPDFLALKPQQFMPKSSLALIGTTLVSPDTPRPKKSCVQMLLNGSAYTYLGHKVSTKSYFCCIYRQQPMYVPQSTDPKLSMYSNWQIRKPAEDNPFKLTPYQGMGLYESRKYDRAYTIAKPKELNLIQTHSSYWTFKEEKEKNKEKEDIVKDEEKMDIKSEESCTKVSEQSVSEGSGSIKRESEDDSRDSYKTNDEAGRSDSGSVKRVKIFEGGFKSSEDYTYVRGRGRGNYVCETCGIRCKKPSMLKKHIRTHTDLRPYACGHCTFSFKTKGNLTKHLRSKAHYKRCVEMGIDPVPTVVDESHVNEEALALQGKMEQEDRLDNIDCDDDDDEDDDDDDDDDDEEDDDDPMGENQVEDALSIQNQHRDSGYQERENKKVEVTEELKDCHPEPVAAVSRSGVLVMQPTSRNCSGSPKEVTVQKVTNNVESSRDSPMDLSVKKTMAVNFITVIDKTSTPKKSIPRRPSFLPLMSTGSKPSITDLRSPVGSLASPGTQSTPIREHPSEILSPVTESSTLLKTIYNTTERASHVSFEKQSIVPDPTKENGCSSSMLQAYLKERAMLDTTIKRQQYKDSSSDTSPDSPHSSLASASISSGSSAVESVETLSKPESTSDGEKSEKESKKEGKQEDASGGISDEQSPLSMPSSSGSCSTITSSALQSTTSRMPTPPANLTVMNSGGMDTKTSFLVPSGVVPSSLNRLGNDDGKCKCSICHKEFNRQAQLSLHMNIHYMERPYRCDSCAVSFRTNGHLQKHKRSVSHFNKVNMNMTFGTPSTDNPRPFKCHDCKIAFRIHGHLAKHLRSKMHIMKLECLGKLPFGTYAEIERSGANLNEIDTTDCDNSLESLQAMASRLYEKDPSKLSAWQNQQEGHHHRVRTVSNSSTNSDDYPLQDEQDDALAGCVNDDDIEGDEDEDIPVPRDAGRLGFSGAVVGTGHRELHSPHSHTLSSPIEIGSGATAGLLACHLCHEKFLDLEHLSGHLYSVHKVSVTYRNS